MGDPNAFLKVGRQVSEYRPACERVRDYGPVWFLRPKKQSAEQASRCMDCGTPFCHWGCPVANYIPEWNDLLFRGRWKKAYELLEATNILPEITGRVCPALCEYACVLGIGDDPVTIRENELAIVEYAFQKGYVKPRPPKKRTGKKIAVIGSGPAGLSCAAVLNRAGHRVVVFERDKRIGGILRYGIPDFKLEKRVIDRRVAIWKKESILFRTGVDVGREYAVSKLEKEYDAVCLAGGSRVPRDLPIPGRRLKGIYFAMDYLVQSNKRIAGERTSGKRIDAESKRVLVIGGGDTGADCVGTAHRQGAQCVIQIELLEQPPECRTEDYPWPLYPMILKTSTSHEEGGERKWGILTKRFAGTRGHVRKVSCVKVAFEKSEGGATCPVIKEIPGSEFEIETDMVVLAVGFLHPEHTGLLKRLGLERDARGNLKTDDRYMTSREGVFAAGDMRRGQSLVVWAIAEGQKAARSIDCYLTGRAGDSP
jgi:glutamate synthase (NADPH/NADH) small chain